VTCACARPPKSRQTIPAQFPPLPISEYGAPPPGWRPVAPRSGEPLPAYVPGPNRHLPPTPTVEPPPALQQTFAEREGDTLGGLIADARQAFAGVRDYSCTFVKQERIGGRLESAQTAQMLVREQPFSVYLRFTAPSSVAGQEVCYIAGHQSDKVRVRGSGLKAALGFISLSLDDPRIRSQSRHSIAEAGLRSLIEQIASAHAALSDPLSVETRTVRVDGRPCSRVDFRMPQDPRLGVDRGIVYFDRESKLPIRFEGYSGNGELLESYTYLDLQLNVGLPDSAFSK
jgi:hypothetical protein